MTLHASKPTAQLLWRCRLATGLIFLILLTITLALWRASANYMDMRLKKASEQNAAQAIERFATLFEDRLSALRHVGHYVENIPNLEEAQFDGLCASTMADVPGIRAILLTDTHGLPTWIAPQDAVPKSVVFIMTADPKLDEALKQSLLTRQTALTEAMDVPEIGAGFLGAAAVSIGNRHLGYVIGIYQYQDLLSYLAPPDMLMRYRIGIAHGGRSVYPPAPGPRMRKKGAPAPPASAYGQTRSILLGGQDWTITMEPATSPAASPVNRVSLTILGLGLSLAVVLSRLAWRWQWRALVYQAQARDSQSRLERTGLSLAEVRTEMDMILNSVDAGIIFYDEHLEPVQANAAFQMIFGIGEDEPAMRQGQAHHEYMIQLTGSETKYWSLFNALRSNPEQTYTDELEVKPRGNGKGAYRVLLRRATRAARPDGTARGILVIYKDLTKMKMMDRVKDEFLSNVTHELRSPLASIKGFAETIRRDPKMAEETRDEFIKIICEEAARLQNLIDELLDLRRMEAQGATFVPVAYDIKALVDDIIKSARSVLLTKNITVRMQWDGLHGSALKGDVAQMTRALRNLLVNAVKYSPEGGEIGMTGHLGQQRVWVEISDRGSGIEEKDLTHIFDKFYRASRQGHQKGTGLGLAIVKHIIEMHGGHLGVRSVVGMGTTFRVDLPRSYALPAPAEQEAQPQAT